MKAGSDLDFIIDLLPWEFIYVIEDNVLANIDNFISIINLI